MVHPGHQALHLPHQQVGFKGMPCPAGGDSAQGGVALPPDILHALGAPQQEGQLQQAHVLLGVHPAALPFQQQLHQVVLHAQVLKIPGQVDGVAGHGGLHQGRLGALQLLVGLIALQAIALHLHGVPGF